MARLKVDELVHTYQLSRRNIIQCMQYTAIYLFETHFLVLQVKLVKNVLTAYLTTTPITGIRSGMKAMTAPRQEARPRRKLPRQKYIFPFSKHKEV